MAGIHRQQGKPHWFCAFYGPNGRRHFKSTKTGDRKLAEQICRAWNRAAQKARSQTLTPDRARAIIEDGGAGILEEAGQPLPNAAVREFMESWLREKKEAGAGGTAQRYRGVVNRFVGYLGAKANQSLANLTKQDVAGYRDSLLGKVATGTVNTHLRVLRAALTRAVKNEYMENNAVPQGRGFRVNRSIS